MLDALHKEKYTALRHRSDVLLHTLLWWLLAEASTVSAFFCRSLESEPRPGRLTAQSMFGGRAY